MDNANFGFCESCSNKIFTSKQGLVCGLTKEKPDFEVYCDQFAFDLREFNYAFGSINELVNVPNSKRILNLIIDSFGYNYFTAFFLPGLIGWEIDFFLLLIYISLFRVVYYFVFEATIQRTIGKSLTQTRIVDADTFGKPTTKQILIRTVFRLPFIMTIDMFCYMFGFSLHDKASNTILVINDQTKIDKLLLLREIKKEYLDINPY